MSGTWASGWIAGDIVTAAEFKKGAGSIFDTVLGASAATIDITGIVNSYAHLLVVASWRGDNASTQNVLMRFNNDSGANYDYQIWAAAAASTTAAESFAQTGLRVGELTGTGATAGYFNGASIIIPNYAGTTANKNYLTLSGQKSGTLSGTLGVEIFSGGWRTVGTAINRLTFLPAAGNFIAGTRLTVYGLGA